MFLHMEETQSNLILLMKKLRPREGSQLFEAVVPKHTLQAACLRLPQSCCQSTEGRKSGQEAPQGGGPQAWPFPSARAPANWPPQAVQAGPDSLPSLTIATFLCLPLLLFQAACRAVCLPAHSLHQPMPTGPTPGPSLLQQR